jgi:hypothetical protein
MGDALFGSARYTPIVPFGLPGQNRPVFWSKHSANGDYTAGYTLPPGETVPSRIQGSAAHPPGDAFVGKGARDAKMVHARDGAIAGVVAFLAVKYGLNKDTLESVLAGLGVGWGAYYLLQMQPHTETNLM